MTTMREDDDPRRDELLDEKRPKVVAMGERSVVHERERRGPGCAGGCALLIVGVLLGGLAGWALLLGAGRMGAWAGDGMVHRLASLLTGRSTTIDASQAAVVERIRKLSRLETVEYSMDKIVVGERQSNVLPDMLVGDKLLLIAHGEVIAGMDLSQLQPGDVTVSGDHVSLKLPKPMVLSARLDNAKTRVFSRETGLLVTADPNLETEVRKAAEEQIGQAALDEGILDKAKTNAQATLETLLYGLGFRVVRVQ